ncbi:MAG TPA: phage tail tape measure protein [Parapedobacter sp.]|uniref:phage tail tape measure protein n=1 Tax=Parapedobacter sp. TaxID=1958893 RepID=UPI002D0E8B9F|nr:phage tail tape measure protein [Parapedobacter sp.]HWK58101.1 phage tail tape measure protein [Parapedobacter sp.]
MAKTKLKQEDLVLNIIVNGNKAQSDIGKVSRALRDAKSAAAAAEDEMKLLEKRGLTNTKRYRELTAELDKHNKEIAENRKQLDRLNQSLKLEDQSIDTLERSLRNLIKLRKQSVPDSDAYKAYSREIDAVTARLNDLRAQGQRTASVLTRMGNGIKNFFSSALGGLATMTAVITGVRKATDEFSRFDDKIADVMKTTNAEKEAVMGLNAELEKLDTRTSQEDLLGLGRIGGKLGITDMDELRGFIDSTNQLVVALNEDLGGNVEQTVAAVGKLVDIFGVSDTFGMEQGLLKVGSAINELGMASTANEGYMVEFARRMAGVAPLAGITVQQILGLGATLDQLGQTSEVSSTALSKLFLKLSSDAASFAKYAGMEVNAFKDLLEKDFMAAFTAVLHGVKDNANGINELAATLGDLGLDGGRVIGVLGSLANNTGILTNQINLANDAFARGTSLTEEYNIKNATAAAELDKARKEVTKFWRELGEKLWPVITSGNNLLVIFLQTLITLISFTTKYWKVIAPLTVALVSYYATVQLVAKWEAITTALMAAKRTVLITLNGLYALLTGNLARAAAAQRLLNIQVALNPYAAAAALVLGLATALVTFSKRLNEAEFAQKALNEAEKEAERISHSQKSEIERLTKLLRDETRTRDEKLIAVKNLRDIMPGVLDQYTDEQILAGKATKAIEAQTKAIILQAKIRARQDKIQELEKQRMDAGDLGFFDMMRVGAAGLFGTRNAATTAAKITVTAIHNIDNAINELTEGILDAQGELNKLYSSNPEIKEFEGGTVTPGLNDADAAKARAAANRARLAELEEAKKAYQSQLEVEGLFRKDRREMTTAELEKLLTIENTYQEKTDEINRKYQHSASNTTKVAETELLKRELAEKKYRDKLLDPRDPKYVQEQEQHEERLKLAGVYGKKREELTAEQLKALERLEAIHAANIGKIDAEAIKKGVEDRQKAYQDELTDLRIRNNEELSSVRTLEQAKQKLSSALSQEALRQIKTLNQAKRILQSQYQQEEANLTRKHLEELRALMQSVLDSGEWDGIDLADKILSPEEKAILEEYLRKVREQLAKLRNPDQTDIAEDKATKVDVLGMSVSDWEMLFANLEAGKLGVQDMANALLAMNQIWAQYNAFVAAGEKRKLQEFEDANNRKKESLKKRLEAETISQEAYNREIEKLDKNLAKKRARMEYDQAKRERNIAISNAIANTAVAVTKVLAQGGIAGIVLAGIVSFMGALQLATILKQPLPSLSGYADGGFLVEREQDRRKFNATYDPTRRGYVHGPTVITGEDGSEFVASKQAVDNPSVKPVLDVIDTAQRNGTISTLNLENIMGQTISRRLDGFARGGYMDRISRRVAPPKKATNESKLEDLLTENVDAVRKLNKNLEKPITANVSLLGKSGFYEKDAEYREIQNSANL